jgi:hypothetical protein
LLNRLIVSAWILCLVAGSALAEDGDLSSLVREFLSTESEVERADLKSQILALDPHPAQLASCIAAGRSIPLEVEKGWLKRDFIDSTGEARSFLLFVPQSYLPISRAPLLVYLHDQVSYDDPGLDIAALSARWAGFAASRGYLLAIPSGCRGSEWWSSAGTGAVLGMLKRIRTEFNVDENRIFCTGDGEGGTGCYALGIAAPGPFAAFLPIGGHPMYVALSGNPVHLSNLLNRAFCVGIVEEDRLYPGDSIQPVVSLLSMINPVWSRYHLPFESYGQPITDSHSEMLTRWVTEHPREPYPRLVVWEGPPRGPVRVDWLEAEAFGEVPGASRASELSPFIPALSPTVGIMIDRTHQGVGVKIAEVIDGTSAAVAGFKAGDLLLSVNGKAVDQTLELRRVLADLGYGRIFKAVVRRGTSQVALQGHLGARRTFPPFKARGPFAKIEARRNGNEVDVDSTGVTRFSIGVSSGMFDLTAPIRVRLNGWTAFNGVPRQDPGWMLDRAGQDRDRTAIYEGRITVDAAAIAGLEKGEPSAGPPGTTGSQFEAKVWWIVKSMPPRRAAGELLRLLEAVKLRPAELRPDPAPLFLALVSKNILPQLPQDPAALAATFFEMDPGTSAAWPLLVRLREHAVVKNRRPAAAAGRLSGRCGKYLRIPGVEGRTKAAIDLTLAWLAMDQGMQRQARSSAAVLVLALNEHADMKESAEDLFRRAGIAEVRAVAPEFSLETLGKKGPFSLAEHRHEVIFLLFDAGDDRGTKLGDLAGNTLARLPRFDTTAVCIPVTAEKTFKRAGRPLSTRWQVALPGKAALEVAGAYRVAEGSALVLIGREGKVYKSYGWDLDYAGVITYEMTRAEIGVPLKELLGRIDEDSWAGFAGVWQGIANSRRPIDRAVEQARSMGPRARLAVCLAAAARGERLAQPPVNPRGSLRIGLALAWCDALLGGKQDEWKALTRSLGRTDVAENLNVTDALFDLGLNQPLAREALECVITRSKDWRAVSMALRTLAWQDTDLRPRVPLRRKKDKRWQVRLALAEALAGYRHQDSVDGLIGLLGDKRMRVRTSAAASLESLTRLDLGPSQKRWVTWRKDQGRSISIPPRRIGAEVTRHRRAHEYAKDAYFGLKIASDRMVFVLDKSDSMFYGLFDRVVEEVDCFLAAAGPTTSFSAIEFAEEPVLWKSTLQPANQRCIAEVVGFLGKTRPYGPTNIMDSLVQGLDIPEIDSLVLLSDGMPNRGQETATPAIVKRIGDRNRYARIAIHCVWMCEGRIFEHDQHDRAEEPLEEQEVERRDRIRRTADTQPLGRFLQTLARCNDGTFGVAFADVLRPHPDSNFRDGTDK